jgi:F-type H+-transporting ATPase subunit b
MVLVLVCAVSVALGASDQPHGQPPAAGGADTGTHAAAEGHADAAHGGKGWVSTDTYRVMNFVVLAAALVFLLRKPMAQALNGRIKGIQEQLEDLEARKAAAERQLAEYNQKFAQLDQEAEKMLAEYARQGEEARARILQEAEAAVEKMKLQARRNIEHEINRAKARLQAEVTEKALAKAEELIRRQITANDQEKLVDEYLKKVVA